MLQFSGTICLQILSERGEPTFAGNIYGNVADLAETGSGLHIMGQPDSSFANYLMKRVLAEGRHLKARVAVPYCHQSWLADMELKEITPGNPPRVHLATADYQELRH